MAEFCFKEGLKRATKWPLYSREVK
jgi:hypothetical protein